MERVSSFKEAMLSFEEDILRAALAENRYNRKKTAKRLGLSYDQLRGLIRKHGAESLGL